MVKITVGALKKKLEGKTKKELVQEIADLYKKLPAVKEYYQAQEGDIDVVLDKYKDIIKKEFVDGYTRGFPKARLGIEKKTVQDVKKMTY